MFLFNAHQPACWWCQVPATRAGIPPYLLPLLLHHSVLRNHVHWVWIGARTRIAAWPCSTPTRARLRFGLKKIQNTKKNEAARPAKIIHRCKCVRMRSRPLLVCTPLGIIIVTPYLLCVLSSIHYFMIKVSEQYWELMMTSYYLNLLKAFWYSTKEKVLSNDVRTILRKKWILFTQNDHKLQVTRQFSILVQQAMYS